jgi:hypothetical protein
VKSPFGGLRSRISQGGQDYLDFFFHNFPPARYRELKRGGRG